MDKIASFQVDHTCLEPGMYISRVDGDVVTYDLRFIKPNTPPYLSTPAMHTIEHLFATYARNSAVGEGIVYVGPMGCRTGFYLLTRGGDHPHAITHAQAITLVQESLRYIAAYEGPIPGASAAECGNWREHDLPQARAAAEALLQILQTWDESRLSYGKM